MISLSELCDNLHGFKDKEEIIKGINQIHYIITGYFLNFENQLDKIDEVEVQKLKEIALYMFDLATDNLFDDDFDSNTKRDLLNISLNIYEQVCKYEYINIDRYIDEYFELMVMSISCATLSGNYSKSNVLFKRYINKKEILNMKFQEDRLFLVICAFIAKDYKYINRNIQRIIENGEINDNGNDNVSIHVLKNIVAAIYEFMEFLKNGDDMKAHAANARLDIIYKYSIENNRYREIWIIDIAKKVVKLAIKNCVWTVLDGKLDEKYIRAIIGNESSPLYELWPHQVEIINESQLDTNYNYIIHMPTSSGKSIIAQISILKTLEDYPESTVIYVVPTNALLNQVKKDLGEILERIDVEVDIIDTGYDYNFEKEQNVFESSRVIIVTQEKLDSMIRKNNDFLAKCKLFVFDEFHNIGDSTSRGLLLEFVIAKIKLLKIGDNPKFLLLSAVLPNVLSFKKWIGEDITKDISKLDCRPTKQVKILACFRREIKKIKRGLYTQKLSRGINIYYEKNHHKLIRIPHNEEEITSASKSYKMKDFCIDLAERFSKLGNVLVYIPNKDWFASFCKSMMMKEINITPEEQKELNRLSKHTASIMGEEHYLVKAIEKGIAYHHSDLPDTVKDAIEKEFKKGIIKVLACTTTLAQGLNFPISTIIVGYLNVGTKPINFGELENLIGRAGRAMYETEGYVVLGLDLSRARINKVANEAQDFKDMYLFHDKSNDKIVSVFNVLLDAIDKPMDDIEKREQEIINMFNSLIFDLVDANFLESDEDITNLIHSLYFSIDSDQKKIEKLFNYTKYISDDIQFKINELDDPNSRKVLRESGISIDSAILIYEATKNLIDTDIDSIYEDDKFNEGITQLIDVMRNIPEFKSEYKTEVITSCLYDWIFMKDCKSLCNEHFNDNMDDCIHFINSFIKYKSSWFFSIVAQIIQTLYQDTLNYNLLGIMYEFNNLPGCCKFGLPDKTCIEISENGLYDRELLIKAIKIFNIHTHMELNDATYFYQWSIISTLISLEQNEIYISEYESELWSKYKKSLIDSNTIDYISAVFESEIKGYGLYSKVKLSIGEPLIIKQESNNQHDQYAIEIITLRDEKLGYIDRTISQKVCYILNQDVSKVWAFFNYNESEKMMCEIYLVL